MAIIKKLLTLVGFLTIFSLFVCLAHGSEIANQPSQADCFSTYWPHDKSELVPVPELAHTPVRDGRCDECHHPHGSEHASLLVGAADEICWSCHEPMRALQNLSHVHDPFGDGDCAGCHSPHGTDQAMGLLAAAKTLCSECHDTVDPDLISSHKGFSISETDCSGCHSPHASDSAGLPHAVVHDPFGAGDCSDCHTGTDPVPSGTQPQFCFECHRGFEADLALGTPHKPVLEENGCTKCHAPHTSPHPGLLIRNEVSLCSNCHAEQVEIHRSSTHNHPKVDGKTCIVCHDPHLSGGEHKNGAVRPIQEVCLTCHEIREHADHPMGEDVLDPRTGLTMMCNSCHAVHGSEFEKFMIGDAGGRLCIECHSDKLRQRR